LLAEVESLLTLVVIAFVAGQYRQLYFADRSFELLECSQNHDVLQDNASVLKKLVQVVILVGVKWLNMITFIEIVIFSVLEGLTRKVWRNEDCNG
jgi:ubiquinone/menaquinone biosynthesis C-methylase UbiE